jgi:hypothetical protein
MERAMIGWFQPVSVTIGDGEQMSPENKSTNKSTRIGSDELNAAIVRRRRAVELYLRKNRLDRGLSPEQRHKLTALVLRYQAAFRQFRWLSGAGAERMDGQDGALLSQRDLHSDQGHGASQRRVFSRKVNKAVDAINDVLDYATDGSKTRVYGRILESFAVPKLVAVKAALTEIVEWNDLLTPAGDLNSRHPRAAATEALMAFLAGECGLPPPEARSRTAMIFTGFKWRESGTENEKPTAGVRRETEAVRKRQGRAARRK